jgi:thiamine biosynthesis lipoprotein
MNQKILAQAKEQLGSVIEIKLPEKYSHLFELCFNEINRIEQAYSRFLDSSELTKLNGNLGKWQKASDEYLKIVEYALDFNKKTEGYFDITLKSTLEKMGYDKQYSFKPKQSKETIAQKIRNKMRPIIIDKENKRIMLRKEIEFGGLGKGYALDCVAKLLDDKGVDCYYINGGGDIYARQGSGEPWIILLEHPDDPKKVIGKLELDKQSIAGSAPNRRRWGKYHHLINAKTKEPENSVKAIFVIAKTGVEADAYATALFTAGFEEAIRLYKNLPVEILLISQNNKVFKSDGFKVEYFD